MKPIWYSSTETGAPALNNAAGSLISVLDALLTTGYNVKTVQAISVASGVATATINGHGYEAGKTIAIAGATPAGLNGNAVVASVVDVNTVTFPAAGVADGAASGTITARRAPLGWTKLHSGTNVSIYGRTSAQASLPLLRVLDTAAGDASTTYARALMVETASGVDTYTASSPTAAQLSGGVYISKGASTTAAKSWLAIGDDRTLYLFTDDVSQSFSSTGGLHGFAFGDLSSVRSGGDAYGCLIIGGRANTGENYITKSSNTPSGMSSGGMYIARATNHIGGSTALCLVGRGTNGDIGSGSFMGGGYPSPVDGGMLIDPTVLVREDTASASYPFRGWLRGVAAPLAADARALHGTVLSNLTGSTDSYLAVACTSSVSGGSGMLLFNVTSEWV